MGSNSEDEANNISTTVNTQGIIQANQINCAYSGAAAETSPIKNTATLSASVYLNYFTTKHDEKLIDLWFKTYIPIIREQPSSSYRLNKKLKVDIMNGVPVPMRGHGWIALVGN